MKHHTKDKGDVGLAFCIARLVSAGINVALPLSEHLPFDLIAINHDGALRRISVKYRALRKRGTNKSGGIEIGKRSNWADRHGTHTKKHGTNDYDAFAIYCPNNGAIYFVKPDEFGSFLWLDVNSVRAQHFAEPSRIF